MPSLGTVNRERQLQILPSYYRLRVRIGADEYQGRGSTVILVF